MMLCSIGAVGWWTEMEAVILRKIPRGFVPKQNMAKKIVLL